MLLLMLCNVVVDFVFGDIEVDADVGDDVDVVVGCDVVVDANVDDVGVVDLAVDVSVAAGQHRSYKFNRFVVRIL